MNIRVNRKPIQLQVRRFFSRIAPSLRVERCRAEIAMRDIDEACVWLRWRMVCRPRPQPGTNELVGLALLQSRKRNAEVLLRFRVEPIQAGLIHLLTLCRRNPDQKIDKLRRTGFLRARITLERWH